MDVKAEGSVIGIAVVLHFYWFYPEGPLGQHGQSQLVLIVHLFILVVILVFDFGIPYVSIKCHKTLVSMLIVKFPFFLRLKSPEFPLLHL